MNINKLVLFSAAFMLAWLLGSMPAGAAVNPACDPILFPTGDCDGDGVLNGVDACPATVLGSTFGFGAVTCDISGLDGPVLSSGCSLAEVLDASLDACDDNAGNHGKFVSCVAKATNLLKKQKVISGAQKGQIQSCAAQTSIGKKPKP